MQYSVDKNQDFLIVGIKSLQKVLLLVLDVLCSVAVGGNLRQVNQLLESDKELQDKIAELRSRVEKFACGFAMPGYPDV